MKNTMKFCLISTVCMGITLHSAEKPNADAIIRKALATGNPIDRATMNQILQQQHENLEKQKADFIKETVQSFINAKQPIPIRITEMADEQTAAFAYEHNKNFFLQSSQKDQSK